MPAFRSPVRYARDSLERGAIFLRQQLIFYSGSCTKILKFYLAIFFQGYGGRSSPAWNYKSNFKSPVMSRNSARNVDENLMRSIMSILPARRFFAKRAAPDVNPDFDHFSATRGWNSVTFWTMYCVQMCNI